jgi:hypothetical protein
MTPTQKLQQIKNWIFSWNSQHSFKRLTDLSGNQFEVDGELEEGKEFYAVQSDGMIKPAGDGEYHIDGRVLNVVAGLIAAVISGNRDLTEKQINPEVNKKETMAENVKMVSDALLDGTEITITGDKVAAGADIRIVKDGQELLPPAGELELKSGSIVIVDETGKISEVKADIDLPGTDETKSEADEATEMSVPVVETEKGGVVNIETIHGMMKEMMEAIGQLKDKVGSVTDKQEKMKEEFAEFKKAPKADPLKRNSQSTETKYQFGSGENPRVQMLEALKGHFNK